MRRLSVMLVLVGVVMGMLSGCGGKSESANQSVFPTTENKIVDGTAVATVTVAEGAQMQAISGQVIAEFYDTATRADYVNLENLLQGKGFRIIGQIPVLHMVQIGVTSDDQIVPLIADLKNLPYIEDAYPNMVVSSTRDPNPSEFTGSLWLDDISARDAWNISTGKREVIIGIVDSGVDPNNAQFKKNNIRPLNSVDVGDGHGLGVESVAIANGDDADVNGTGANNMTGVCWNCSAVAYDIGVKGITSLIGVININAGITEAINAGAKVVNISQASFVEAPLGYEFFRTSIKKSVKLAHDKAILLIFGAGNKPVIDNVLFLPRFGSSEYENYWKSNVIVVSGSYKDMTRGLDSIYQESVTGSVVDIAAPCLGISTAAIDGSVVAYNGTSYAAPMVTGIAGLIWSVNSNLSPSEVKAIITDPKNTSPTNNSSIRVLNAYRALSDPRVAGIKVSGIAMAVLMNGSTGVFAMGPMQFSQTGNTISASFKSGALLPDGTYEVKGGGQLSGNAVDITFDLQSIYKQKALVGVKGIAYRSTFGTGDLFVNATPTGKTRFDILPIDAVSPICTGMGNMGTIGFGHGTGVTQPFTVSQSSGNPNILAVSSSEPNIRTGEGWLSGNQIFLNFVDVSDGSNPKVTILKGSMASSCGSGNGTWQTFPFGSDIPTARGIWSLTRQ